MLTVKAPIELKCQAPVVSSWEGFYHKISGNYQLMSSRIEQEDLLHLLSVPPEIYIGEGGMTSLVNNTRIQNNQETKLEIVNNLLNRIVLTDNVNMTYQDRTYITEVLNKLGIQNVSQFMSQVTRLKQKTQNTEQLISLYWNHLEELNQVVQEYSQSEKAGKDVTEQYESQTNLHLHETIMSRLQTGAVYQILQNFIGGSSSNSQYVSNQELQITEQKRVAANILLNQLRNVVQEEKTPLIYRNENYYETMNLEEDQVTQDTVNTQITSAVLLSLIDNLYFSRFEKQLRSHDTWLNLEHALYQTMENTLWRLKNESASHFDTLENRQDLAVYQSQVYEQELQAVYRLLALGQEEPVTARVRETNVVFHEPGEENVYLREAWLQHPVAEAFEGTEEGLPEEGKAMLTQQHQLQIQKQVERYMEITRLRQRTESLQADFGERRQAFGDALTDQEKERKEGSVSEEEKRMREVARESYPLQYLNLQHRQASEEGEGGEPRQETDSRQEEGIRLERETKSLLSEYRERLTKRQPVIHQQETRNQILTEFYESPFHQNMSEQKEELPAVLKTPKAPEQVSVTEEKEVLQTLINKEENLEAVEQKIRQINQQNIENFNRYQEILQQQGQTEQKARPSVQRMRQESLKALQNPAQLIEEYRQETKVRQEQRLEHFQKFSQILPEETKRIYERLEQYQSSKGHTAGQEDVAENNIGLLLHDIQQIERESRTQEQISERETEQINRISETVLEKWEEGKRTEPRTQTRTEQEQTSVSLVHKSVENQIDEEMLEQILNQNRTTREKVQVEEQEREEKQVRHTTIHRQEQNTLIKEAEDLTELIQRGVQRQIGNISDQVYSKLEKRLQNEKKRRGY